MTTPEQIEDLARGLTKAQVQCLSGPIAYRSYGVIVVQSGTTGTLVALERRRLLDGACFTPLGQQVRAHLLSKDCSE